jgi:hypothetical protein
VRLRFLLARLHSVLQVLLLDNFVLIQALELQKRITGQHGLLRVLAFQFQFFWLAVALVVEQHIQVVVELEV